MTKIYISPSQQTSNMYYGNIISERKNCEAIAVLIAETLRRYDVEVKVATLSLGLTGRTEEAKTWGADIYIPVHTNCCNGTGAVIFANNNKTMAVAKEVVGELDAIAPVKSNRYDSVIFRTGVWTEMAKPHQAGMDVLYSELNFHDHKIIAPWLVKERVAIAEAYVRGLAEGYAFKQVVVYYKLGDKGLGVKDLQSDLTLIGYPLTADGSFGPITETAVIKFQRDNGLVEDGLAGPITLKLIEKKVDFILNPPPPPAPVPPPEPKVPIIDGVYWRVVVLSTPDYEQADKFRNELKAGDHPNAFVVKYIKP